MVHLCKFQLIRKLIFNIFNISINILLITNCIYALQSPSGTIVGMVEQTEVVPDRKLYPWVIVCLMFFKIDFSGPSCLFSITNFSEIPPLIKEIQFGFLKICERIFYTVT